MMLPSTTYVMVYVVIIPLGIVGLVHVTRTALLLILVTVLMVGGVDTVKQSHTHIVKYYFIARSGIIHASDVATVAGLLIGPLDTVTACTVQV